MGHYVKVTDPVEADLLWEAGLLHWRMIVSSQRERQLVCEVYNFQGDHHRPSTDMNIRTDIFDDEVGFDYYVYVE